MVAKGAHCSRNEAHLTRVVLLSLAPQLVMERWHAGYFSYWRLRHDLNHTPNNDDENEEDEEDSGDEDDDREPAVIREPDEDIGATADDPSGLIHSGDSQIARSSSSSRHESRNCRQRHAGRSPSA